MLRITNLCKSFGDKKVLSGLNLTVPKGSIFGFLGSNGAGKTTTMKAILGLLKIDSGEILVADEPVHFGKPPTSRIGFLPDVPSFYSYMTPREYLAFCGRIIGLNAAEIRDRGEELLNLVGLQDEKRRIKGYSRGMKQRLGIAQALMNRPELLICDEPTSALDPIGRKEILDLLLSLKGHTTVLFSTHILSDVERICTDVAFLKDGKIEIQGSLSALKSTGSAPTYAVELGSREDERMLCQAFPGIKKVDGSPLTFSEEACELGKILQYIASQKLSLNRLERLEPTLESLYLEVAEK